MFQSPACAAHISQLTISAPESKCKITPVSRSLVILRGRVPNPARRDYTSEIYFTAACNVPIPCPSLHFDALIDWRSRKAASLDFSLYQETLAPGVRAVIGINFTRYAHTSGTPAFENEQGEGKHFFRFFFA